jgi:membrane fusion protein (multidrug efflux system)
MVMLADADNKVAPRPVQTGEWHGKDWIVLGRPQGRRQGDRRQPDEAAPRAPGCPASAGSGAPGASQPRTPAQKG